MLIRFRSARWLDTLYPLPDPCTSIEEWHRLTHRDLEAMALEDLDDERLRLRLRLAFERDPDPWFTERQRRLDQVRARHGRRR